MEEMEKKNPNNSYLVMVYNRNCYDKYRKHFYCTHWVFYLSVGFMATFKQIFQNFKLKRKSSIPAQPTFAEIDAMDGFEFEKYMKQVYEILGYSAHHTPLSGDQGADLILTSNEGIRIAVQLKRYSGKVSNKAVQEVVAAKAFHKCTKGMVVTNSYFMDSAIQLARANDVNLINRTGLTKLLNESSSHMNETRNKCFPSSQDSSYKDLDRKKLMSLPQNTVISS